ncbi:MAG: rubrerythrin [Planctomycetes bacterium]|nr:rubrerythrin [Planctomycetota bacterium]
MKDKIRKQIITELIKSYCMEIETVINYQANSIWLDGIRAKHIKDSLTAEVTSELGHSLIVANRIKTLEGRIPGSFDLKMMQKSLQPPKDNLDVKSVIKGVIDAEAGAIAQYQKIIELSDTVDPVTQDMCITLKGDEEEHRRLFKGFLREAESMHL